MHRILPAPVEEIDTDDAYRDDRRPHGGRPWLMVNMIASADGGIEVDGVSGPLGSSGDKDVFGTLRTIPDVILAGSGTVIAEDYNPPSTSVSMRARRLSNGAWATARIAVVSNSLSLDPGAKLFDSPQSRPIVITSAASDPDQRDVLGEVADIIVAGDDRVDLPQALVELGELGANVVLSEGGPGLNSQLLAHGLVDELCLSLAPLLVGGDARRIAHGPDALDVPLELELRQVLTEDHYLFLRYVTLR